MGKGRGDTRPQKRTMEKEKSQQEKAKKLPSSFRAKSGRARTWVETQKKGKE